MSETNERELNLKWLLYRTLRSWRGAVIAAVIIGLVVCIGSTVMTIMKVSDEAFMQEALLNYEREYASYLAEKDNLLAQMDNINDERGKQLEYNEKSVLMKIDPLRVFTASSQLYVDYDYQIMPEMTYQNIDMSDRILTAYGTYMASGDMSKYILDNLSYEMELRYLKEIFSADINYQTNFISFHVLHRSAELCEEVISLAEEALLSRVEGISDSIAEHRVVVTNETSYEYVDLDLEDTQRTNLRKISNLDIALQEANEKLVEWKKTPEPEFQYTTGEIIKSCIKMLIVGGIVGALVAFVVIAFGAIVSGKLLNPRDVKEYFGIHIVGELPADRVKRPFAFVSRWCAAMGGITVKPEDYENLAKVIGSSLKQELSISEDRAGWKKIAFVGMAKEQDIQRLVDSLDMGDAYTLVCAQDILTKAASVDKVAQADCVVLVERQETTLFADIEKELEALKAWNKPVLGAVVVNVDAVM